MDTTSYETGAGAERCAFLYSDRGPGRIKEGRDTAVSQVWATSRPRLFWLANPDASVRSGSAARDRRRGSG